MDKLGRVEADAANRLAIHVATCCYDELPSEVLTTAKLLLMDTLAVAWAGSAACGIEEIRNGLLAQGGAGPCDIWGANVRATALDAAFLNSASAAALEFDSQHAGGLIHSDIVSLPAVLAVAQMVGSTGKEFLAALVIANDVSCRLALAADTHSGWWHTSVYGVFGAAAACAKLLGLDASGIRNAMGIALSQSSGTQQPIVERSVTKRLQSALASRGGVLSALLASWGVSGPSDPLQGTYGLYAMYERGQVDRALDGLGERYEGCYSSIKKYPTCGCNHALIEATLQLMEENDFLPSQVVQVTAMISPYMHRLVGGLYEPSENPQVAAQFSAQYVIACALLRGRVGLADLQTAAAMEPAAVSLAKSVRVEVQETNTGHYVPAEVELVLDNGTRLARRIELLPGSPECPVSSAQLARKIEECLSLGACPLSSGVIERLSSTASHIDALSDMRQLFDCALPRGLHDGIV